MRLAASARWLSAKVAALMHKCNSSVASESTVHPKLYQTRQRRYNAICAYLPTAAVTNAGSLISPYDLLHDRSKRRVRDVARRPLELRVPFPPRSVSSVVPQDILHQPLQHIPGQVAVHQINALWDQQASRKVSVQCLSHPRGIRGIAESAPEHHDRARHERDVS